MLFQFGSNELIWNDFDSNNQDYLSPEWHKDLFVEREKKIESGKDFFIDWDQAKQEIWANIKCL